MVDALTMIEDLRSVWFRVRGALMRRGRSAADAEDLVQEAWLRLAGYGQTNKVDRPEAFLMQTALNLSVDSHRAQSHRGEQVLLDEVVLIDAAPGVEAVALSRERVLRLQACLSGLNPRTRDIVMAHRMQGMSYKQIARKYGLSVSAVEKQIARGVFQLSVLMEGW